MNGCITTGRRAGYCRPGGAESDFGAMRALVDEFLFFSVALDGIVVDPDRANDSRIPCKCVDVATSRGAVEPICFRPGVIGTLTQEQVKSLCHTRVPLRHPEGIQRRIAAFQRAADECRGTRVEERLACMSRALSSRGERYGEPNAR